jgi:hypothetical protein
MVWFYTSFAPNRPMVLQDHQGCRWVVGQDPPPQIADQLSKRLVFWEGLFSRDTREGGREVDTPIECAKQLI